MNAEDPRAVHYVLFCVSARGRNVLVSNYYIGVTCNTCLNDRPPPKLNLNADNTALKVTVWILFPTMTILAGLLAYISFKTGATLVGGVMALATAGALLPTLLMPFPNLVKAVASKILARKKS